MSKDGSEGREKNVEESHEGFFRKKEEKKRWREEGRKDDLKRKG